MRIFFWSMVSSLIVMLVLFQVSVPILYHPVVHKLPVKTSIYLDQSMTPWEVDTIQEAAEEWEWATNHKVQFTIEKLPTDHLDTKNSLIILKVSEDYPKIMLVDMQNEHSTLGLYDNSSFVPYIFLVTDRMAVDYYKSVVEHELGHYLGLSHATGIDGIGTLMYPSIEAGSDNITPTDLKQFCKLYDCDPEHI